MTTNDLLFVIGIFVFIFLLWIISGGPTHKLAYTGPILNSNEILLPKSRHDLNKKIRSYETKKDTAQIFSKYSQYKGVVTMNTRVYNAGSNKPLLEYITIRSNINSSPIDISGWTIRSNATGVSATIPKGTEVPRSGTINAINPIILTPGSQAIISSGRSPIGASFRENICIGYIAQFQPFYPPTQNICPIPFNELKKYDDNYIKDLSCINYTNNIKRCSTASAIPSGLTASCTNFAIKYLNYNGCVSTHKNNKDFSGNTWRIFLGRDKSMWRKQYEQIQLLDTDGKMVDEFSY